ncbi:hypothetical protein K493DRAFT_357005 [Basidiobolus meristosporus CBS 931.73]|uniref:K Homology domain-containing protein n=1 Tax=Basidiobolus meristosporus CBS 931.73 TaxID=1314790 RepID=A0A1Y1XX53_9FUNG|nr:hypothetical protein K493DRAFT_357005 [Basidiobolus meristosporus CBS 931.73]|eukprot:ORX90245.1 hypothetical protein K493DRAFT_357005 [Basidiobolus meristosporus CBS 931.73]
MDSASVAFCLVQPALSHTHNLFTVPTEIECHYEPSGMPLSKLTQFCEQIVKDPCSYEIKPINLNKHAPEEQGSAPRYVVLLSGPSQQLMVTQRTLLERYPSEAGVTLKIRCDGGLFEGNAWKSEIQAKIDDIIRDEDIVINLTSTDVRGSPAAESKRSEVGVSIQGKPNVVDRVRQVILRQGNMYCEELKVDVHLLGIVSGPNHSYIRSIEKETQTKIVVPTPYGNFLETHSTSTSPRGVLVLGEKVQVEKALLMLANSVHKANTDLIKRHITLQSRKFDWLPILKYTELMSTIAANGTSVVFPDANQVHPYITVYGQNEVEVSRTTKTIMQMTSGMFSGSLWLENNIPSSQAIQLPSREETEQLMSRICMASGAEIAFRNHCFEVCGGPDQLRTAFRLIGNEYSFQRETKFQVELASEHREFISGKKNGKINKIMKVTNTKIGYENLNEFNFFINIYSPECSKTLEGLKLLQEELPAEISFYVPENYHKRIIGVGGKNIQRIMKQFGVYVKFSTAEEFAAQGVCVDSGDNVVARTPAKNIQNLANFKKTITDMVESKDQEWLMSSNECFASGLVAEPLPMPKSNYTRQDSGYSHSTLVGNDPAMHVSQRLQDLALNENRIRYPLSTALHLAVDSEAFRYESSEASLVPRAQQMLQDFLAANHIPFGNPNFGFCEDDSYLSPGRHNPTALAGHMRDQRSYSLFDQRSTGSFFGPTVQVLTTTSHHIKPSTPTPTPTTATNSNRSRRIQRRQTDQGVTSNLQIHQSARAISESFFDHKNNVKSSLWSNYAPDNGPARSLYNTSPRDVPQERKPFRSHFSGWPNRRVPEQGFNPFETPANGGVPKPSFYSGYYGF